MKYIIIIFLIIQNIASSAQDAGVLIIRHIGAIDKPIRTLLIYNKQDNSSETCLALKLREIERKDMLFDTISVQADILRDAIMILNTNSKENSNKKKIDFGSFYLGYFKENCENEVAKGYLNRNVSIKFFKEFLSKIPKNTVDSNEKLRLSLMKLIKRINY